MRLPKTGRRKLEAPEDPASPFSYSPFARFLGVRLQNDGTWMMPFSPKIIGSPILPAIHGGMTGAFLETSAITSVTRALRAAERPKPIGLTINYLRPGRAVDSYANVSIVKQGRRIVAFEARAWQDDANKPIASAFGHFMLRAMREVPSVPTRHLMPDAIGLFASPCQALASKATIRRPCLTIETLA